MSSHPPPPSILAAFFVACSGNYPRAGGNELGRTPNAGPSGEASGSVPGAPSSAGSAPGLRSSAPSAAANAGGRESRRTSDSDLKGRSRYGLTSNRYLAFCAVRPFRLRMTGAAHARERYTGPPLADSASCSNPSTILSTAAADGEEAYSILITLLEYFGPPIPPSERRAHGSASR